MRLSSRLELLSLAARRRRAASLFTGPYTFGLIGGGYWGWRYYDPFWADMYKTPYERYLEERYYAQSNLRDKEKDLRKHSQKYAADGYLDPKEREKLAKDQRKLAEARERLARLNRYY